MASITVEKFLECVAKSELVAKDLLSQTVASLKQSDPDAVADADRLAEKLIQANLLTRWQCDNLLQGKSSGFMLGPFKLLRLLGAGGMSTVYLGEHTLMQCLRAIKVLPAGRVEDSSYLERFRQEAIAAARLNHPNIVQAFDIGQHKKHHYIVMEYVEGKDLQALVKDQGPLDYDMAANYIRQAAEGLGYAHSKNLIHRDIKPANLLVDGKGVVKLLDLGLARFVDDKQPSLTIAHDENVLGTADYLAPEQAVDSHGVDSRADIYSLGCTLYFLLTGHPPFPQGTLPQRIHWHQSKTPASIYDDRPDAPQALVDVCTRMMAKTPEARFQTAKEIADVLAAWLANRGRGSGEIVLGERTGARGKPLPPPRRSTAAVAAPLTKPTMPNDTIADMDSETIKGASGRPMRPAARRSDSKSGDPSGSSGKLGKEGAKPDDSGRVRRSGPSPILKAKSLDAPDDDDANSVLFGPTGIDADPIHLMDKRANMKKQPPPIPKWYLFAIGGGLLLAVILVVVALIFGNGSPDSKKSEPTPPPDLHHSKLLDK